MFRRRNKVKLSDGDKLSIETLPPVSPTSSTLRHAASDGSASMSLSLSVDTGRAGFLRSNTATKPDSYVAATQRSDTEVSGSKFCKLPTSSPSTAGARTSTTCCDGLDSCDP
ncbi:adenylylsulfate kinase, putative [Babesia ovata]|uniref:Adenylylsulfate kinase, putative n=1 Tax=Babesia ovata TaxID=189622 RepID=A0A2H6K696_9APIC|nr:adenylylsulfate kinase, putative [Babesia ovata]GBE58514.1 adenylylsulfate kinase, putative [Babesia ovata]